MFRPRVEEEEEEGDVRPEGGAASKQQLKSRSFLPMMMMMMMIWVNSVFTFPLSLPPSLPSLPSVLKEGKERG